MLDHFKENVVKNLHYIVGGERKETAKADEDLE
jgi:hypothetical protein